MKLSESGSWGTLAGDLRTYGGERLIVLSDSVLSKNKVSMSIFPIPFSGWSSFSLPKKCYLEVKHHQTNPCGGWIQEEMAPWGPFGISRDAKCCAPATLFQANLGRYEPHFNIHNLSWFYTINAKIYLHNYIFFKGVFPGNRTVIPTYPNMVQPKILLAGAFEAQIWAPHRPWVSVGCGPVFFLGLRDVAGHDPTLKMRLRFWQVLIIVWLWLVHHCSMILWYSMIFIIC